MSYGTSRIPQSAQQGVHEHLVAVVDRHLASPFRKPIAPYNQAAFEQFCARWDGAQPVILDSGCGVGWSTLRLAQSHPKALVVGIDQSEVRLMRRKPLPPALWPENLLFLRADVIDYSPGDDFYAMLIEAHRDLSDEQSALLNARLVLLLANHIGDLRILEEAITAAKADL